MKKTIKLIGLLIIIWLIIPDEKPNNVSVYHSYLKLEEEVRLLCGKAAPSEWATIEEQFNKLTHEYDQHFTELTSEQLKSISLSIIIIQSCLSKSREPSFLHTKIIVK